MSDDTERGLRHFEVGESFTGFFVLRKKDLRFKKDGGRYLSIELGDQTGRLQGNIWEEAESCSNSLVEGGVVKVMGSIELFRDVKQVSIKKIRQANDSDGVEASMFIPRIQDDPAELFTQLIELIATIANPDLKRLLDAFFEDEKFTAGFCSAPGGKLWHHNRLGGLLQHTLSLAGLVARMAEHYPGIDRDLVLTGALLHDIGKIEEYRYDTFIDYTDRGRLIGHIPLGGQWVAERAARLENFPPELLDQVMHLVLSHQAEFGSPVKPMTREAFLLHYADQVDSKLDALDRIAEDGSSQSGWHFVKLMEQFVFLGSPAETLKHSEISSSEELEFDK